MPGGHHWRFALASAHVPGRLRCSRSSCLRDCGRGATYRKAGQARCLAARALALAATLALIPLWSWNTVGRLDTTPYSLYADRYFPFDRPGWRFDARPPQSPLPPDMAKLSYDLGSYFAAHRLDRLPAIVVERLSQILGQSFPGWRLA